MKESLTAMEKKMEEYLLRLEQLRLDDYLRYLEDRKKLFRRHLLLGIARGVGMGIGFTIVSALLVVVIRRLAEHNLPLIGELLAQLAALMQQGGK